MKGIFRRRPSEAVYTVTDARRPMSEDIDYRERRYLITMGIRTLCFLLSIVFALTLGQVLTLAAQLHYMAGDNVIMEQVSREGGDNCERIGILYFGAICHAYQTWAQALRSKPAASVVV